MAVAEDLVTVRSKKQPRLPVVLSINEVFEILTAMSGVNALIARLMYGGGLRIMEALRLRVQDIDFANGYVIVRDGKGGKDRSTLLAPSLAEELTEHLKQSRMLFDKDKAEGVAGVYLPGALARKYPNAGVTWGWQYVFPSKQLSVDPRSGLTRRHHLDDSSLRKALSVAQGQNQYFKKGDLPYLSSFICYAPVGVGHQYSGCAKTSGTCRCKNNRNLHPCFTAQPG